MTLATLILPAVSGVIMAGVSRHGTARPVRWKEPRALAAPDHASRRPHQRGGRPSRRRVGRQCGRRGRVRGTLIRHAAAHAIRALAVAMIQAPLRALLVGAAFGALDLVGE